MDRERQLQIIGGINEIRPFCEVIGEIQQFPLRAAGIDIFQINVGKRCNLACRHCHVMAGPDRREEMSRDILGKCLSILESHDIPVIDITGGSPEMNPHLQWFIEGAGKLKRRLMVRSNCSILLDDEYSRFIDIYTENGVEIITSLPDLHENKNDRQRGKGVFSRVIEVMKILNDRGYGSEGTGLVLDIVHNPAGAYLPASQDSLVGEYRKRLLDEHGIRFNSLYSITNIPVGRYLDYLVESGNYEDYMNELCSAYNPAAVTSVMCRNTISVGWDGRLYDCDFNQMLDLPVNSGVPDHINNFDLEKLKNREIVVDNHCYGCVAGSGSSCQGSTV